MKVLRSRLYEIEMRKQQDAIAKERRGQVGSGDRSEKIRTYNFKENRITDHRINFTMHQLAYALDGDLDELIADARRRGSTPTSSSRPPKPRRCQQTRTSDRWRDRGSRGAGTGRPRVRAGRCAA